MSCQYVRDKCQIRSDVCLSSYGPEKHFKGLLERRFSAVTLDVAQPPLQAAQGPAFINR